jgi:predicted nucleic acid-binding protein
MICVDTSSFVAFIKGEQGRDVELAAQASLHELLVLAPVSITELLSDPRLTPGLEAVVLKVPRAAITAGYWERAGKLRRKLMRHGFRPKIADTLIAQTCLDHGLPLITRDRDFEAFRKTAGLQIL